MLIVAMVLAGLGGLSWLGYKALQLRAYGEERDRIGKVIRSLKARRPANVKEDVWHAGVVWLACQSIVLYCIGVFGRWKTSNGGRRWNGGSTFSLVLRI